MRDDTEREHDRLEIDERPYNEDQTRAGNGELYFSDHATHESESTMKWREGRRLINRTETIMRQYPWVVLTMGAGLGYLASRRRRLS